MYFSCNQSPAPRSIDKLSPAASWDIMMISVLSDVKHPGFNERLRRYQAKENCSEIFFESENHRQLFCKAAERLRTDRPHMLAIIYLLTANRTLWSRICHRMIPAELSFDNDQLGKVNIVEYTLYSFAKDLHTGSQHITFEDMSDPATMRYLPLPVEAAHAPEGMSDNDIPFSENSLEKTTKLRTGEAAGTEDHNEQLYFSFQGGFAAPHCVCVYVS